MSGLWGVSTYKGGSEVVKFVLWIGPHFGRCKLPLLRLACTNIKNCISRALSNLEPNKLFLSVMTIVLISRSFDFVIERYCLLPKTRDSNCRISQTRPSATNRPRVVVNHSNLVLITLLYQTRIVGRGNAAQPQTNLVKLRSMNCF